MEQPGTLLHRLRVSDNHRFLVTDTNEPFFWLGDTAWELFHRLSKEDAERYLTKRDQQGFTLIQAVALAEVDGLNTLNAYGERPLVDNDPYRPNEAYFSLVEEYIRMAASHHLYVGLLPTWGDKVVPMWGIGPQIFDPARAHFYGTWLGTRLRDLPNIVWIMGGDRPPQHESIDYRPVWRAMSRGIREGVGAPLVMTYHPSGGHSTGEWLHEEEWLDVNMIQSGHGGGHDVPTWDMVARDYQRKPVKPVLDGEPNYEDHPVSPWPKWDPANGYYRDHDVRKQLYRSVFAGACGVTYGHQSVWQFYEPGRTPVTFPDRTWQEALDRPAASQVKHLRGLIESRHFLSRVPDQGLLDMDAGSGGFHIQATRDENGSYAFLYLPEPRTVIVRMDHLSGSRITAHWFDPRSGERIPDPELYTALGTQVFTPPDAAQFGGPDWVLVLESIETKHISQGVLKTPEI